MYKKIIAAFLIAAALAASLPAPRAEAYADAARCGAWETVVRYSGASSVPELLSHFSAFTGITYWLFSGAVDFFLDFNGDGFSFDGLLPDLYDRFRGRPEFNKDAPGTFTL